MRARSRYFVFRDNRNRGLLGFESRSKRDEENRDFYCREKRNTSTALSSPSALLFVYRYAGSSPSRGGKNREGR